MPFRYHASDGLDHGYHPLPVGKMPGGRQDCVCQSAGGEQTNVSHCNRFVTQSEHDILPLPQPNPPQKGVQTCILRVAPRTVFSKTRRRRYPTRLLRK